MDLITVLACGVANATSGTARIYRRGTTTAATYYNDAEGLDTVTAGTAVQLNSYGQAVVYVNQPVTVVVNSTSASAVLTFDHMTSSPVVEVRSQSFTGTDYDDAETGGGKPTTLQEALDSWFDSAGAKDFNVLVNGVSTALTTALAGVRILYSVKNTAYGATGDGTTDDAAAIQLAVDAAEADGGGTVYFPAGTYAITDRINVPAFVNLLGEGAESSVIRVNHLSSDAIALEGGPNEISGLTIDTAASTNTGSAIRFEGSGGITIIDRCTFSMGNGTVLECLNPLFQVVTITDSTLENSAAATGITSMNIGNDGRVYLRGCAVQNSAAAHTSTMFDVERCIIESTTFYAAATSGTIKYVVCNTSSASIANCNFLATGGATVTAIEVGSGVQLSENGNIFGSGVTPYLMTSYPGETSDTTILLYSREARRDYTAQSGTGTISPDCLSYKHIHIRVSDNSNFTIDLDTYKPPQGHSSVVFIHNNSGGTTGTITLSGVSNGTNETLNTGVVKIIHIEWQNPAGTVIGYVVDETKV
jgi:hypothetical protein